MKRTNTASEDMIKDFVELKKQGITNFICTTHTGRKNLKPIIKHTAQGVSSYANKMYNKYGDDTSVEIGYFDDDLEYHVYITYHA